MSFDTPEYVANVDGLGTLRILESFDYWLKINSKIYQASTSELYGGMLENKNKKVFMMKIPPFILDLLMGLQKFMDLDYKNYREAYNIFACNGILFNHESPRRGETFVTRK